MKKASGVFLTDDFDIKYSACSDKGLVRKANEDSFLLLPEKGIFCVADGVGGLNFGDVASRTAVETIKNFYVGSNSSSFFLRFPFFHHKTEKKSLEDLFVTVNEKLYEINSNSSKKMATTLSLVYLNSDSAKIGHVGDSRIYLYRNNILEQKTEDHSLVAELQRKGLLSQESSLKHTHRNIITRAIGSEQTINPDILKIDIYPDDLLLLCTDGVTSMIDEQIIMEILSENDMDIENKAKKIVDSANAKGGKDNITVILILFLKRKNF